MRTVIQKVCKRWGYNGVLMHAWVGILFVFAMVSPARGEAVKDLLRIPAQISDKAPSSMLVDIVDHSGRLVAVGERGHIVYSDLGGRTWRQAQVPVSVTLTAVTFASDRKGWAVGHDGVVLQTHDGGKSWKKQIDGILINELMLRQVKKIIEEKTLDLEVAESKPDTDRQEEITRTLEDWDFFLSDVEAAMAEGPIWPLMDLWFKDEKEGIVIGSFGMILRTGDGGAHWEPLLDRMDNVNGYHYYGITQCGDLLFIAGEAGMLYRSHDWGETWQRLRSPYEGSFFGILGSADASFVIAFGLRGNVYFSHDKGTCWKASAFSSEVSVSGGAVLSDGSVVLVNGDGTMMRSVDGGTSFSPITGRFPGAIDLAETRHGNLIIVGLQGAVRIDGCHD